MFGASFWAHFQLAAWKELEGAECVLDEAGVLHPKTNAVDWKKIEAWAKGPQRRRPRTTTKRLNWFTLPTIQPVTAR